MIYLVLLVWDNGPQRGNALISLFHSTLDIEGAVGGALGLCPRDGTCGGLEICVLVLAPYNLAPLFMNGQGATSSEFASRGWASTWVGPVYLKGS